MKEPEWLHSLRFSKETRGFLEVENGVTGCTLRITGMPGKRHHTDTIVMSPLILKDTRYEFRYVRELIVGCTIEEKLRGASERSYDPISIPGPTIKPWAIWVLRFLSNRKILSLLRPWVEQVVEDFDLSTGRRQIGLVLFENVIFQIEDRADEIGVYTALFIVLDQGSDTSRTPAGQSWLEFVGFKQQA